MGFRNTRTRVSVVFDNLETGATIDEIMDWFHVILFDNGTPAPLRYALRGHVVVEAIGARQPKPPVLTYCSRPIRTSPSSSGPCTADFPPPPHLC
jgi:hypothetical protein